MDSISSITPNDFLLLYFYREVILYYEQKVLPSPWGFHVSNTVVTSFIGSNNIDFKCIPTSTPIIPSPNYKKKPCSFFHLQNAYDRQTKSHLSTLASFLYHIRNCFAHGHFEIADIDGLQYLCVYDIKKKGKKGEEISMMAQAPIFVFLCLIEIVKRSQKIER